MENVSEENFEFRNGHNGHKLTSNRGKVTIQRYKE